MQMCAFANQAGLERLEGCKVLAAEQCPRDSDRGGPDLSSARPGPARPGPTRPAYPGSTRPDPTRLGPAGSDSD